VSSPASRAEIELHEGVETSASAVQGQGSRWEFALLLYYITDRTQFLGNEDDRRSALLAKIEEAVSCGVDFIQLREKDLSTRELEAIARAARSVVGQSSRLLINSRTDIAIACRADGVHLRSNDISPSEVREVWAQGGLHDRVTVGVSCHAVDEVRRAASDRADFAVFAPVYEKKVGREASSAGLEQLREACKQKVPVLALGGVTLENARACLEAGAAGIAGIRLFQKHRIADVVQQLRS
jgi:thiamine-phosphate pyrophosphorylase